jgi:hypothetical protein
MKKSALITLILLFNCLTFLGQTNKLPIPSKSFIEKAKKSSDMEALYFTKYLGKKSERVIERYDSISVCAKEYEFKTGIRYKTNSCNETSIEAEIIFPNYSKNDVVKFVEWFFNDGYNKWNKSKTKYQPKEEGEAGCYLEIKEFKGKIILIYSCSC